MSIALRRQAVRLYRNSLAPRHIRRHNARAWLAAVERLGDKWLLHKPMQKASDV